MIDYDAEHYVSTDYQNAPLKSVDTTALQARLHILESQNAELESTEHDLRGQICAQRLALAELEGRSKELQNVIAEQKANEFRYRDLFHLAPVGYLAMDEDGMIKKVNLAGTLYLQLSSVNLVNTPFSLYLSDEDKIKLTEHLASVANSRLSMKWQVTLTLPDGSTRPVMLATSAIRARNPATRNFQVMIIDIAEQLETEKLLRNANGYLEELAHHDPLTRLPNRTLFTDRLESLVAKNAAERKKVGVIYFDLDGFKPINDTLGHHVGDKVLCMVAERVRDQIGDAGLVARLGGDEFAVILDNPRSAADAFEKARGIADTIRTPMALEEGSVNVSGSIGLSMYPEHATRAEELVRGADAAMYKAKQAGRDQVRLYSRESVESFSRQSVLETSLARALANDELELHFQPIYNTTTLTMVSVEALLRWQHPTLGTVSPGEFIPLAEKTDRIVDIGRWVLESACKQARAWHNQGFDLPVAVNVSTRQLLEPDFANLVASTLRQFQLSPQSLEIEITESALITDHTRCRDALQQLQSAGHIVTIDDFGTGRSSLARLVHLPVSRLKIDRMFVSDIEHSAPMRAVIKSIINMAHELDMRVVSEGIEKASQLEFLAEIGCDAVQGFMMSRAELPGDITKLLRLDREKISGLCLDLPHLGLEKIYF